MITKTTELVSIYKELLSQLKNMPTTDVIVGKIKIVEMAIGDLEEILPENTANGLKHCPFCGGESKLKDNSVQNVIYDPETLAEIDCEIYDPDTFWVECPECMSMTVGCDTEKEAIEAWNRRA